MPSACVSGREETIPPRPKKETAMRAHTLFILMYVGVTAFAGYSLYNFAETRVTVIENYQSVLDDLERNR